MIAASICPVSTIFPLDFEIVQTVWYFLPPKESPPPPALALAFELDVLEALPPTGTEINIIILYNVHMYI